MVGNVQNYVWQIEIDGITLAQFTEASGLSIEISVTEQRVDQSKGLPVIKKLPGQQKFGDITLKRGMSTDKVWWTWLKQVQNGQIAKARRNVSIVCFDNERGEVFRFNISNAWPSKISLGPLQASGTDVLMEEVTLVHEGLELA